MTGGMAEGSMGTFFVTTTATVFCGGQRAKEKTLRECATRRRVKRRITCAQIVGQSDKVWHSFRLDLLPFVGSSWVRGSPIREGELNCEPVWFLFPGRIS